MVDWADFQRQFQAVNIESFPDDEKDLLHTYKGVSLSKLVPVQTLVDLETFEVRDDDVFLVTYPKAGTTWTQQIIRLIMDGCDAEEHKTAHLMMMFPFLEMDWVNHYSQIGMLPTTHKLVDQMPRDRPRKIKSHLPAWLLPRQLLAKKPKVVYIARSPKDVAVSYYHMHKTDPAVPTYDSFSDFLEDFVNKKVVYGDWFIHNLFWWERRHDPNVMFIKYEDMKRDTPSCVRLLAHFLGYDKSQDEIDRIVEMSSFQAMKNDPNTNPDSLFDMINPTDAAPSFMRKGAVGDWKNHFTMAENERFDELYRRETLGTGLTFS